jgi:hypothetical protein
MQVGHLCGRSAGTAALCMTSSSREVVIQAAAAFLVQAVAAVLEVQPHEDVARFARSNEAPHRFPSASSVWRG